MRTFDNAVEKVIGMLLAGKLNLRVKVDGSPVPAVRNDAVEDCSGPMLIIDPRQQNAEFGCDTGARLLLQRPLAQYAFEQSLAFDQACTGDSRGQTMRKLTLECCLPARNETVIDPEIGSEQRALGSRAKVFDRAELEFHLARFHDGRIGAVEWTISLCLTAPEGKNRRDRERRRSSDRLHEAGRNTQIAAGSLDAARTATNSRSSSGTNSEVRAPGIVGTSASRR